MVEKKTVIKGLIGVVLIVLFSTISFSTDYVNSILLPTKIEILLMTSSINESMLSGEVRTENIFLRPNNDVKIDYEVTGEIGGWVTIEGPKNLEKENITKYVLRIEPPINLLTDAYSGKVLIHFENNTEEIPISLNVTQYEPIKLQYGDKNSLFAVDVKVNGTEFFGDLMDYKNNSTCFEMNLPEGSKNVYVEIGMEKDDDIDACIYSGNLDEPYMCSLRPRGQNESLKVVGIRQPLAVCLYASGGEKDPLVGNTANFSGTINFAMTSTENVTNTTITNLSGEVLYVYTVHCDTCREFASSFLDFISGKNITLKFWTDDGTNQPDFNTSLEKYIVGYYTPKDLDAVETTAEGLLAEGCPDYAKDYLKNNLPSSYTCLCTLERLCDCFEGEGDVEQRLAQTSSHFNNLMAGAA